MKTADKQYIELAHNIIENGYFDDNRTGVKTYKLPHRFMQFDLEKEFPILQTKFVAFKTAVKELLWIFKDQSNDVKALQEQNVHIWDEWMMEDGSIGTSYGWVVKKYNQIDKLIDGLKNDPQGRRHIISLWQNEHLEGGALYPCCFMTMWDITDGRLNCMLVQRSCDLPLGGPFNMTQYAVLTHLIAQVVGVKPGLFTHVINNAHIYENQVEGIKEQINRYKKITGEETPDNKEEFISLIGIRSSNPTLWINPDIDNFYDFTIDDIKLENYVHMGSIKMPVSV